MKKVFILILIITAGYVAYHYASTPNGQPIASSNPTHNTLAIRPQTSPNSINIENYYLEKSGFIVVHAIENDSPAAVLVTSKLLPGGPGNFLQIESNLKPGTYFALLYSDDGDGIFDINKDPLLPLYSEESQSYSDHFVAQFIVK